MRILLIAALALSAPAWAEAPPTFTVLKIVQGDDTDFKVVPSKEAGAEKDRLVKDGKAAVAEWEQKRDAFLADKANRKKTFREPKPPSVVVSKTKDFPEEAEAAKYAREEKTKAEGRYAVIRVVDTDKSATVQVILQKKIKATEKVMADKYESERESYKDKQDKFYSDPNIAKYNPPVFFKEIPPEKPKVLRLKENLPDRDAAEKAKEEIEKTETPR